VFNGSLRLIVSCSFNTAFIFCSNWFLLTLAFIKFAASIALSSLPAALVFCSVSNNDTCVVGFFLS